jgi:hypothetical protein
VYDGLVMTGDGGKAGTPQGRLLGLDDGLT